MKNFKKKLTLNKETVALLNDDQMINAKGGKQQSFLSIGCTNATKCKHKSPCVSTGATQC